LKNLKKNYIKKLSQVIAKDINNIKIDLNIIEAKDLYKIDKRLLDHPKLKILKKIIDAKKEYIKYLKAQKIPDLKIKATYLNRENRYDYINLSFSFDLPIYNREEKSILIGLKELSSLNKKYENELLELKYGLENSLIDVEDAYKRYKIVEKILKDDLAHKLEVVLENLTVNTSTIESAIEILEKSLEFELQKIDILFDSNKAYSEVLYYLGDKL
ncbi:MAG TPA: hypothetical protein EYP79_05260, partial [Campylobacterales bacterium]|nr:hypothetical protein [Campylobacterales bacterium]